MEKIEFIIQIGKYIIFIAGILCIVALQLKMIEILNKVVDLLIEGNIVL